MNHIPVLSALFTFMIFFQSSVVAANEMSILEKFFGPKKGTVQYHLTQGREALASTNLEMAVTELTKAIDLDSTLIEGYFYRGLAYYQWGERVQLAKNDFEQVLRLDTGNKAAEFWFASAESTIRRKELTKKLGITPEKGAAIPKDELSNVIKHINSSLDKIDRYRTILIVRDLKCKEIQDVGYQIITWQMDHVKPGSFSIDQCTILENYPDGACDNWTTIGNDSYQTLFTLSVNAKRPDSKQIESFINIEKYRQFITADTIDQISMSHSIDGKLIGVETEIAPDALLGKWRISELRKGLARSLTHIIAKVHGDEWHLKIFSAIGGRGILASKSIAYTPDLEIVEESIKAQLTIWLDASNYTLENAQIQLTGNLTSGEEVSFEIEQVIGDINGDIKVLAPPISH